MKIAVIIPCRDRLESVSRCLTAIARSVDVALERRGPSLAIQTLVVNDHSSAEFAPTLASQHPRVTITDVVGAGPGAARNTGLKHVDADLYLLTDSDCTVADDWCDRAIEWHANRCAPMGQGVPWLYQCQQNRELGSREEMLYRHMFSHYLVGGRVAMIDPRCLMLSREYFEFFPRDLFAAWIPDASAEDRSVIGGLIQQGLRIDWCPDVRVFHEDPRNRETAWRQKYRHGSGRLYVWPKTPDFQFLLNRYFLNPMAAGIDPAYVVPAHLAFLLGYRDSCRHRAPATRAEWWDQFVELLFKSVAVAEHWLAPVELALAPLEMIGSFPAGAELRQPEGASYGSLAQ